MTRLSTNNATASQLKSLGLVVLCDLHFDSETLYVHDGFGALAANSRTYSGLGETGGVEMIGEDLSNVAQPVRLTLSGVDSSYVSDVMTENCQGRQVTLWVGMWNVNSGAWYDPPFITWEGRMDYPQIEFGDKTATIRMNCEHRLMREPCVARYTDQDQQLAHAGDSFFNLQWMIALSTASWGHVDVFHPVNQAPVHTPGKGKGGGSYQYGSGWTGGGGGGSGNYTYGSGWT